MKVGNGAVQLNILFPKYLVLNIPPVGLDLPIWGTRYFDLSDNKENFKFSIMKYVSRS